jgi:dihydrofolate synthase / folylpolyglutamate synthase
MYPTDLASWLDYINDCHPRAVELSLSRIRTVAARLDLLSWSCPVITVAGTNGKGSCIALLKAILQAAGYQCGAYTSPHLLRYNERIYIGQQFVSDADLCRGFSVVESAKQAVRLTWFEFSTLVALYLFKEAKLDVLLLEVGLGGRYDAVNIIDADIAIISSIDLDHTDYLGETLEQIAWEKAGIMRIGKPCIWGEAVVPARVQLYAKELGVPLWVHTKDFAATFKSSAGVWWGGQEVLQVKALSESLSVQSALLTNRLFLGLGALKPGIYPVNIACVIQAITLLHARLPVSVTAIWQGLAHVSIPGRFQIIPGAVTRILDIAHNPASIRLLAENLQAFPTIGRRFVVIGMLAHKDILGCLSALITLVEAWYVGSLTVNKGATAQQLSAYLSALSVSKINPYPSIPEAYQAALSAAQPGDQIIVLGSFYTVAAVMELL